MKFKIEINYPETPKGKRRIKRNVWGNTNGYVGNKLFWEFGTDEKSAQFWVEGNSLEDSYNDCWVKGE
ncbi:hypothetical protein phiOC_p377 [Ochrobactrum phage vB_OspM_OC]|nr:hypothetical protein phiOC_p377 [Ochrobactrum phage vB_OspM_OC]